MGANAMIDLETLGVNDNAPIAQIGAVVFDMSGARIGTGFEVNVDLTADRPEVIGKPDLATVLWWMGDKREIPRRKVFDQSNTECLAVALVQLNGWLYHHNITRVWANSPNFDIRLLKQAYERAGVEKWPMTHRAEMDFRTLVQLARATYGIDAAPMEKIGHTALADAIAQADLAAHLLHTMRLKLP